jgi:hypothetical protein
MFFVPTYMINDGVCNLVEERNNFNLYIISSYLGSLSIMLTISDPTAPLKPLPPSEYVSCDTIQLT